MLQPDRQPTWHHEAMHWAVLMLYDTAGTWWVASIHPTRAWARRNSQEGDQFHIIRTNAQQADYVRCIDGVWTVVPTPVWSAPESRNTKTLLEQLEGDL